MLVVFVVTNIVPNSIFASINPVGTMEEIIMAHPELIPITILLPIKILPPTKI